MINMFLLSVISIIFLSTCYSVNCDDINVLKNTMPDYMKNRAINLVQNGFINQMNLNQISINITTDFNNNYGVEWFNIIGPTGFVAHLNAAPNTLLWLQFNELEIILYKPIQADDISIIKSARIGLYKGQYIHTTVNQTTQTFIRDQARNVTQTANSYKVIEDNLRIILENKLGGYWLVIVTSAAPHYESDWSSKFGINFAMEFDLGNLRFFTYQRNS